MASSVSLNVTGMKCGGCESNVSNQLQNLDGVISVEASSKENNVTVQYDPDLVEIDTIKNTIIQTGYNVIS